MKKIFFLGLIISMLFFVQSIRSGSRESLSNIAVKEPTIPLQKDTKTDTRSPTDILYRQTKPTYSLFLPYWTLPDSGDDITLPILPQSDGQKIANYIYFGIAAGETGIDEGETGFRQLERFIQLTSDTTGRKTITIRMVNDDINEKILDSADLQNTIIKQSISIAKSHGFDEILFDFELKALPLVDVKNKVTAFMQRASTDVKNEGLSFSIAIYGDTFYRARPFDIAKLAPLTNEMYIMAYDFHKSFGTPGPNFPLDKSDLFEYDLRTMLSDFTESVPREKLHIVHGMYGYEWEVDAQNRPKKRATALTLAQIKKRFLPCDELHCTMRRDRPSAETEIVYVDTTNQRHVIWFEDEKSVATKQHAIAEVGIHGIGFWASGYY